MTEPGSSFEARLRRALQDEAATIQPAGNGLQRIRERTQARASGWRRVLPALVAAAVLGVAAAGAATLLGNDGEGEAIVATVPNPSRPPSATSAPTSAPTPAPTASTAAIPVYYLADAGGELRLYREFHALAAAAEPGRAAVEQMLRGQPADPDYTSLWPSGTEVLGYSVTGGVATVDLSAAALAGSGGAEGEERSVQQLVYTVTAADRRVERVRLLVEGAQIDDLWGHGSLGSQPIARAAALDVRGLTWILTPVQGAQTRAPVQVLVSGTAFEGTVTLTVFRGAEQVRSGFVTTAMGEFAEASTAFELPPGNYTVRAYDESGEDGRLTERDSKDFTVR